MPDYQEYPIPGVPARLREHQWNQDGGGYSRGTTQVPYMPPQAHPPLGLEIYPMKAGDDHAPEYQGLVNQISVTGQFAGERNNATKPNTFNPANLGMSPPF